MANQTEEIEMGARKASRGHSRLEDDDIGEDDDHPEHLTVATPANPPRDQSSSESGFVRSNVALVGLEDRAQPSKPAAARVAATAHRVVAAGEHDKNQVHLFPSNAIRTTKYTALTFLPRNLFEQFHRFANIYFLVIVILNWVPIIGAFQPALSMMPLLFVLTVTAVKDLHEDRRRYKSDCEINNRQVAEVFGHPHHKGLVHHHDQAQTGWHPRMWKETLVGDVVRLHDGDIIPADLVLIHSSEEHGLCYIDTANLDGETNLKQRRAVNVLKQPAYGRSDIEFDFNPTRDNITITCELPNTNIYQFNGYITSAVQREALPLGPSSIILRGCVLKNTKNIVGVVVYSGPETKAMLNNSGPPSKRSKLERDMNSEVILCVVILVFLCLLCGFGAGIWTQNRRDYQNELDIPFKEGDPTPATWGLINFWTWVIILQVIVPISLYVTVELVKLGQVFFMTMDKHFFHEETNRGLICRALNLNEDLGQIKYVFSDKTGTLTQNKMIFRKCSVNSFNYKHAASPTIAKLLEARKPPSSGSSFEALGLFYTEGELFDMDADLEQSLLDGNVHTTEFMLLLAICNTVVPAVKDGRINYSSESPDERALVIAAYQYGVRLLSRSSDTVVVDLRGTRLSLTVLHTIEFDSARKRMSLIVRRPDGSLRMYCKGADSIIKARLNPSTLTGPLVTSTQTHLDYYASEGLRTLSCSYKDIDPTEYEEWSKLYEEANLSLEERAEKVNAVADVMERNLELCGATGIEDRLQDGVPEAIAQLRAAGIRVWVITGDKQETAINIGFSCRLLEEDMPQIIINAVNKDETREFLEAAIRQYGVRTGDGPHQGKPHALIIDGETLAYALQADIKDLLLELGSFCAVVLACRTTPLQKASIVRLVKEGKKVMTLAIGDGANDVSMIQSADVGVGISGQEGMQAVMASDYAIAQFRFLERLLLVHGHLNYHRLANMVLYFFYKNTIYVFVLFFFCFFSGFSGQTAIDQVYLMLYNLVFTSLPPICYAIFDEDVSKESLLANPPLYYQGMEGLIYNRRRFYLNVCDSLYQGSVIFFFVLLSYMGEAEADLWTLGFIWNSLVVMVVNLQLAMSTNSWNWIYHLVLWGSMVVYWIFIIVYHLWVTWSPYGVIFNVASKGRFWFTFAISIVAALLPSYLIKSVKIFYFPTPINLIREREVQASRHVTYDPVIGDDKALLTDDKGIL